MALIVCPECGKQISETTPACPHCGYQLSIDKAENTPAPTKIGDIKTKPFTGVLYMALGIIGLPISLLFGPFFPFVMIGSAAGISIGWTGFTGTQSINCPYCGKSAQIGSKFESYKCSVCKKRSIKKGEYLYTME